MKQQVAKLKSLTPKQRKYVDCYDGNTKRSAKKAGISHQYAKELHTKTYYSNVQAAIKDRHNVQSNTDIATRQERQRFWTEAMRDNELSMVHRNRASELLGKSEADFVEVHLDVKKSVLSPEDAQAIIDENEKRF